MSALLRRYIREILSEVDVNPAVGNQLPGTPKPGEKEKKDKEEDEEDVDELDEFSGAGAIAGFAAPLGWTGDDAVGPGARGERKKRGESSWS
jgi:hypothetical protein